MSSVARTGPPVRTLAARLALLAGLVLLALLMALGGSPFRLGRTRNIATIGGQGYWLLAKDGGVFNYGDAPYLGNNLNSGADIIGFAATPSLQGYWTADDDGTVFHYGDAHDYGSRVSSVNDIRGFAARPQGNGYWLVTRDGVVTAKGSAVHYGDTPALGANQKIVGMASTPSGNGYWLVGRDGGVFAFGDAGFYGSTGAITLNKPIIGIAGTASGHGYWMVASDGGVFNYGDAGFFGSTGANPPASGIAGIAHTVSGHGYWLVAGNGKVFPFGDALSYGDPSNLTLAQPVVAIVATPVAHANQVPAAVADTASAVEDGTITVDVLANDTGLGDGPISVSITSGPAHGTASVGSDKRITYSPAANYNGPDSLAYKVTDNDGEFSSATLSLSVAAVNDAPVASGAAATTAEDTPVGGSLHATDVDGDALVYSVVATPTKGSVVLNPATGAYTYTPAANANGSDSFTFRANDGTANSNTATIALTITPVNDAPVASNLSTGSDEDVAVTGVLPASDVDFDPLTYSIVDQPANGTVALSGAGFTYQPDANWNGTDQFTFKANDGTADSNLATVTITVAAVNDAPVASDASVGISEDNPASGSVSASDVDGDPLTYALVAGPGHGTLTGPDATTGAWSYSPDANYNGSDSFTFKANDGSLDSNTGTVTIDIAAVEDAPTFNEHSTELTTPEDTALTADASASDVDGDPLTYAIVGAGAGHGTVAVDDQGQLTYTPASNYDGRDGFSVSVSDGIDDPVIQEFTVDVTPVNDNPVATGTSLSLTEDDPATQGTVTATDVDGDTLTFGLGTPPALGTAVVNPDGTFSYTPSANANGSDSFTISVSDGHGGSASAPVSVTIAPVNDNPTLSSETSTYSTDEDTPLVVPFAVGDVESDPSTLGVFVYSNNQTILPDDGLVLGGTGADRTLTITPALNANGNGTSVFLGVTDPQGGFGHKLLMINVRPVNDPPTVSQIADQTIDEDSGPLGPLAFTVGDVESPASQLTATVSSDNTDLVANEDLVLSGTDAARGLVLTTLPDANGTANITVTVTDPDHGSSTMSFELTVNPVNDAPVATDSSLQTNEDTPITDGQLSASDIDSPTLTYSLVDGGDAQNGTLVLNSDGSFTYTPNANWSGTDSFTYVANDGQFESQPATVTITVDPVNDPPVVNGQEQTTPEDTAFTGQLTSSDVEGDPVTYHLGTQASAGTAVVNPDGSFTYTPDANANGDDSFTVYGNDGHDNGDAATITMHVTPVNDPPTANAATITTKEDTSSSGNLSATDIDTPSGDLAYSVADEGDPAHGTVTINTDGSYTYQPAADYYGPDSFSFTVSDGEYSSTASVAITVTSVDDVPAATADSLTTAEDTPITFTAADLMANDSGLGDAPVSLAIQAPPGAGTLVNNGGTFTFTPPQDFNGAISFTYRVSDTDHEFSYATVTITVTPVNDPPVISNALAAPGTEDTNDTITFTVSDVDSFAGSATVTATSQNQSVVSDEDITVSPVDLDNPGSRTVTLHPVANANGPVTITLTATDDGGATSEPVDVPVFFQPVNDGAPVAVDDPSASATLSVNEDSVSNPINVIGNDTNLVDGVDFSLPTIGSPLGTGVRIVSGGLPVPPVLGIMPGSAPTGHGTVTYDDQNGCVIICICPPECGTGTNSLLYTPSPDFNGTDSFQYEVIDKDGDVSNVATVTVTVAATNDVPVANSDTTSVNEDSSVNVNVLGNDVLGNNPAIGDQPMTVAIADGGTPANGTAVVQPDNTITYTPAANYNGPDGFSYTVTDGNGDSATATVSVTVISVNDIPVANADVLTTAEDTAGTGTLTGSDPVEGSPVTFALDGENGGAAHGTVTITNPATGAYTYTPEANYNGSDSFSFVANDGTDNSPPATITVTITPVNDAPVANASSPSVNEDTVLNASVSASDVDGDSLSYTVVSGPANGGLVFNANGTYAYTPAANYNGPDSFTFKANDGHLDSNTATVTLTVNPVNDLPVANADVLTTAEDTAGTGTLTGSDPVEGSPVTFALDGENGGAAHGTVTITDAGTGAYTYTPTANYNGGDSFTFVANDGTDNSPPATITVTVTPVNDATAVDDGGLITAVDATLDNIDVLGNDTAPNGPLTLTITANDNGTATVNGDNTVKFVPAAGFEGQADFTYKVTDANGDSGTATASITVTDAPVIDVAHSDWAVTWNDVTLMATGRIKATDPDGDTLTYSIDGSPAGISIDSNGNWTYDGNVALSNFFTVRVSDGDPTHDATQMVIISS